MHLLRTAPFYLLKSSASPGVRRGEHKPACCREARLLEENPAQVLQENYKLQPGLTQDCLSAASAAPLLSSGQLGKNSKTATPRCPKGPKGTVRIPDQDMPFFPEEGLSVP